MAAEFAVLGAQGQLGREFIRVLGARAVGLDRRALTLGDAGGAARVLGRLRPRVVINCAAYNNVDMAESHREAALDANARGPAQLAALAVAQGFRLVHFSTDYVFGGDGLRRPRMETDTPAPVNFYGYSKLVGEQAVLQSPAAALVLRVAHLYGGVSLSPGRVHLAQRFLDLIRAGRPIAVTRGQYLNPTSVRDVAAATLVLLRQRAHGLFHVTGAGECPAAEFARELGRLCRLPVHIRWVRRDHRPACRARYTVLAQARFSSRGLPAMPPWRDALAAWVQAAVR